MNPKILNGSLEGLCGQTCIALLTNNTVENVVKRTKCGKNKMSGKKLFEALDLYKILHVEKMIYTKGKLVQLPSCCILNQKGHFSVYKDGIYYDNILGVSTTFDFSTLTSYLEILI